MILLQSPLGAFVIDCEYDRPRLILQNLIDQSEWEAQQVSNALERVPDHVLVSGVVVDWTMSQELDELDENFVILGNEGHLVGPDGYLVQPVGKVMNRNLIQRNIWRLQGRGSGSSFLVTHDQTEDLSDLKLITRLVH